jgi:RNA polymerase-binding transcription factor DksA
MDELTIDQVAEIGRRLRERERTLRGEIREALLRSEHEHHKDLAGLVADIGDESVANMLADVDIAAVDRDVGELREVEGALARMSEGRYGVCVDCGEAIGHSRLKANPAAARCIACQGRQERASARHTPSL